MCCRSSLELALRYRVSSLIISVDLSLAFYYNTAFLLILKRDLDRRVHIRAYKNDHLFDLYNNAFLRITGRTLMDATVTVKPQNQKKHCIHRSCDRIHFSTASFLPQINQFLVRFRECVNLRDT